ncbi:MAG: hypothetical protein CMN76_15315 [Spirochaetaceae bacterium]|nr:hypothetical protein [Spirochaetaceae bacterium]
MNSGGTRIRSKEISCVLIVLELGRYRIAPSVPSFLVDSFPFGYRCFVSLSGIVFHPIHKADIERKMITDFGLEELSVALIILISFRDP